MLLKDKITTDLVLRHLVGFICDSRTRQKSGPKNFQNVIPLYSSEVKF